MHSAKSRDLIQKDITLLSKWLKVALMCVTSLQLLGKNDVQV